MLHHALRAAARQQVPTSIAFVDAGTVAVGNNATITLPTYQAGDLLIVLATGNSTWTNPTGWTSIANSSASPTMMMAWKIAGASESNLTTLGGGTGGAACIVSYRYVNTSAVDVSSSITSASGATSITSSSITTTIANDWVLTFYIAGNQASAVGWTAPASTTTRVNFKTGTTGNRFLLVDEVKAIAGATTTRTGTYAVSANLKVVSTAIKLA